MLFGTLLPKRFILFIMIILNYPKIEKLIGP